MYHYILEKKVLVIPTILLPCFATIALIRTNTYNTLFITEPTTREETGTASKNEVEFVTPGLFIPSHPRGSEVGEDARAGIRPPNSY